MAASPWLKLSPPHGWNVVVWDLAIVTVGVLIALAAQQWADELSSRQRTEQALAGIRAELTTHYDNSVEWRVVEPCIVAQIDLLSARVLNSGGRLDPAPVTAESENFHYVLRTPSKQYPRSSWDAATTEGLVAKLRPSIRNELNLHYAQVDQLNQMSSLNDTDYLGMLNLSLPVPLDPSVRYQMIRELQVMRGRAEWRDTLSGQLVDHIQKVAMVPPSGFARKRTEQFGTYGYCKAHHLPMRSFAQAMKPIAN